jgi:hypothetical protein
VVQDLTGSRSDWLGSRASRAWRAAVIAAAGLAGFAPISPSIVESLYSNLAYPRIQQTLTPLSNRVPISLFDVFLLTVVVWWCWQLGRDVLARRPIRWVRVLSAVAIRTATAVAALYLVFLVLWGLNYRREPLIEKLRFEPSGISSARARDLARESVNRLNALHDPAHAAGWKTDRSVDRTLADAFTRTLSELGTVDPAIPGVPKNTLLNWYFRRAGVAGMTDPYFLETLVSSDLLEFERPAVVAHEWSHLAGIADEGEANLVGWLTCLRGTPPHQYSGWLFLYGELEHALRGLGADDPARGLLAGPRRDLQAIRDRLFRQVNPRVSAAGWRLYDGYLKANRVDQGAASYAEVVRLVLGIRFENDWVPVRARR